MLTGSELTTAIAAVLMGAVLTGILLHWFWTYLNRPRDGGSDQLDTLALRLHEADVAREEAEEARQQAEALLARRDAETAERLALMRARLDGEISGREAELTKELEDVRLKLATKPDGLGNTRKPVAKRKPKPKR